MLERTAASGEAAVRRNEPDTPQARSFKAFGKIPAANALAGIDRACRKAIKGEPDSGRVRNSSPVVGNPACREAWIHDSR